MLARVAAASKCRENVQSQKNPYQWRTQGVLVPLYATVQIRKIQGAAGFCQTVYPITLSWEKPLCEATKVEKWEPMIWKEVQEKTFKRINRALTNASALGFPDVMNHHFFLYMHKSLETALGILTQLLYPWPNDPGGTFIKATCYSYLRLAALTVCPGGYCHFGA
jgi:hypothetical protein